MKEQKPQSVDVAIVGAGLAGLATAALLLRDGHSVVVLERSPRCGGRAATTASGSFRLNLGPHALYEGGPAARVLADLDVGYRGRRPSIDGALAYHGGRLHTLPGGFLSLVTTSLCGVSGKLELARLLASLESIDARSLDSTSVTTWLNDSIADPVVRDLVGALLRLSTYSNDPAAASAGAAVEQLQAAVGRGVRYVDGGWQTLVDALAARVEAAGGHVRVGARVARVRAADDGCRASLDDGTTVEAAAVVLAVEPAVAARLVDGPGGDVLGEWRDAARPLRAACLDVALRELPRPQSTFCLGIDEPLYLSVHSRYAELAPRGGAVVHALRYLEPGAADGEASERALESLMDRVQPGWRERIVERRYLPNMTVAFDVPAAARGGLAGRPGPEVPGAPDLFVAGDWVGDRGQLVDASLASASAAAAAISARLARLRAA